MNIFKKILIALLLAVILLSGVCGILWHNRNYLKIDSQLYSKDTKTLDLRGEEITVRQYEKFRSKLPECEILWNVPFQGGYYAEDTAELTITSLSQKDIEALDYLPELRFVDAGGCTDYAQLLALQERRPEVEVSYSIVLGGNSYATDTKELELTAIAADEIENLQYLPELETVIVRGTENTENFGRLQEYCREKGYAFRLQLGDQLVEENVQTLTVGGMKTRECYLLQFLPNLKQLHLQNPETPLDTLKQIQEAFPDLEMTWEQEICGKVFDSDTAEIDISGIQVEDLDALTWQLTFFPNLEKLIMSDCGIDNETMAEFREEHRADYKVVWTVQLGDSLSARTDDTTFMPVRENVYYFQDHESGNLKYCEDMVCIDVGHMAIHDISFVEYMPNLKYLILAHTEVRDISSLETCKNLVFLELDWSTVRDFTPLLGCTALEDLNVGKTYPDLAPIAQMTWLKNLWMVDRSTGVYEVTQALTDTKIVTSGSATVAGGWRELPNYYAMRDLLGMPYMTW